jgi:hypothetical protein
MADHRLWQDRHVMNQKGSTTPKKLRVDNVIGKIKWQSGESVMRDIRSDLQERLNVMEERLRAAQANYEKMLKQLQSERDAIVTKLESGIAMMHKLMEFEQQEMGGLPQVARPTVTSPASSKLSLSDFFVRKLTELGPMSKDDLRNLAAEEGYFPNAESTQSVDATLIDIARKNRVRQLPDGTFAPAPLAQANWLRRVS